MAVFRSLINGIALGALLPALAAPAAAHSIKTIEGWEINATAKTCSMTTTFTDNVTISVIWAPTTGELGFMAAVPPDSYDLGARTTAPLELSFDGDGSYREWQDEKATLLRGNDSVGVIGNWGAEHAQQLAGTVTTASHVTVRVGDREVGRYELSGSPAAYQALLRCGKLLTPR
jgi:hypothetical protein